MKGKLITIEGISGIGKTFYSAKLKCVYKKDKNILFHKEIMDEKHKGINKQIFSILLSTGSKFFETGNPKMETLLIMAKQTNDEVNAIIPAIESGKSVISDRGVDSICIYQAILFAKKYGGKPQKYINDLYDIALKFCRLPDKTILLTGKEVEAIKRAEIRDSDSYDDNDKKILNSASKLYLELAKKNADRFVIINVDKKSTDETLKAIQKEIDTTIGR